MKKSASKNAQPTVTVKLLGSKDFDEQRRDRAINAVLGVLEGAANKDMQTPAVTGH